MERRDLPKRAAVRLDEGGRVSEWRGAGNSLPTGRASAEFPLSSESSACHFNRWIQDRLRLLPTLLGVVEAVY